MRFKVNTTNREIYNKFNSLNFTDEIIFRGIDGAHINRIINNINKGGSNLQVDRVGDITILKKKNPFNIDVYLK
jgi:hypothetical protein